jgi:hypothetical protein
VPERPQRQRRGGGFDQVNDEVHAWVAVSRAAQGLPEKLTDPAVIDRLVALLLAQDERDKGAG